jgi:hypothetical protein
MATPINTKTIPAAPSAARLGAVGRPPATVMGLAAPGNLGRRSNALLANADLSFVNYAIQQSAE